jgi:hypothetical protein
MLPRAYRGGHAHNPGRGVGNTYGMPAATAELPLSADAYVADERRLDQYSTRPD